MTNMRGRHCRNGATKLPAKKQPKLTLSDIKTQLEEYPAPVMEAYEEARVKAQVRKVVARLREIYISVHYV